MGKPACGLYGLNTIFSWAKSTVDGKISFGGVSEDNVRHAVLLENTYDPRHYIVMEASGKRMSRTTMESPKGFHIKAGQDCDDTAGTFKIGSITDTNITVGTTTSSSGDNKYVSGTPNSMSADSASITYLILEPNSSTTSSFVTGLMLVDTFALGAASGTFSILSNFLAILCLGILTATVFFPAVAIFEIFDPFFIFNINVIGPGHKVL